MKKNVGTADKVVRITLALIILSLFYTDIISGTTAIVFLVLAGVFVVTSFISFCPLYFPFGLSTNKKQN